MGDQNPVWKAAKPFVVGSASGMFSTCCIQPIDMVKVRIQLQAGTAEAAGPITVASNMLKNEGLGGMYKGLSAALTRQVVYTGARLGLFDYFQDTLKAKKPGQKLNFAENAVSGLAAGGLAAIVGNPADLALIRMQADATLPEAERRGYRHVGHALSSIVRDDGPAGLMSGAAPTVARAMALNFGMLAFNASSKDMLNQQGITGAPATFGASVIAGFFASFFSLPFDFVKTQMQKQRPDAVTGKMPFSSSFDCVGKTLAEGGPLRFYSGFPTFFFRIAPHAMITLLAQDQIKSQLAKQGM